MNRTRLHSRSNQGCSPGGKSRTVCPRDPERYTSPSKLAMKFEGETAVFRDGRNTAWNTPDVAKPQKQRKTEAVMIGAETRRVFKLRSAFAGLQSQRCCGQCHSVHTARPAGAHPLPTAGPASSSRRVSMLIQDSRLNVLRLASARAPALGPRLCCAHAPPTPLSSAAASAPSPTITPRAGCWPVAKYTGKIVMLAMQWTHLIACGHAPDTTFLSFHSAQACAAFPHAATTKLQESVCFSSRHAQPQTASQCPLPPPLCHQRPRCSRTRAAAAAWPSCHRSASASGRPAAAAGRTSTAGVGACKGEEKRRQGQGGEVQPRPWPTVMAHSPQRWCQTAASLHIAHSQVCRLLPERLCLRPCCSRLLLCTLPLLRCSRRLRLQRCHAGVCLPNHVVGGVEPLQQLRHGAAQLVALACRRQAYGVVDPCRHLDPTHASHKLPNSLCFRT